MLAVLRRRFDRLRSLRHGVNDASASGGGGSDQKHDQRLNLVNHVFRVGEREHGKDEGKGGKDCQNNFHRPATLPRQAIGFVRNGAAQSKTPPAVQAAGF